MPRDKINAYLTLHHVLVTLCKLAAPFVPFMTELIYQNLVRGFDKTQPVSIHLCDYPVSDADFIDTELERDMRVVSDMVVLGRAARNASGMKNRQPLSEMLVAQAEAAAPADVFLPIILEELNIKRIRFIPDAKAYTQYMFKPQLRTLGPKYGKLVPKITQALNADGDATWQTLQQGVWRADIDGTAVELTLDDVLPEATQKEGFAAQSDRGTTVVLDIGLTPALIEEGHVRELVSKLQTMRREAGFDVMDHITVGYSQNEVLSGVLTRNRDAIAREVLADAISPGASENAYTKEWDINGQPISLSVRRKN
jgi:isoleucyl-tRNA synthetase